MYLKPAHLLVPPYLPLTPVASPPKENFLPNQLKTKQSHLAPPSFRSPFIYPNGAGAVVCHAVDS